MIQPTIGRVVLFYERPPGDGDQAMAALITYVWDDTRVNLVTFDANGNPKPRTSVFLSQNESESLSGPYCTWMPYQKGQAAKTEAMQEQLARKG